MKKLLSLLLALSLIFVLAACANTPVETSSTAETTSSEQTTTTPPPSHEVENPITYLNISCMDAAGNHRYISFSASGTRFDMEYQGDVKKVASYENIDTSFLDLCFLRSELDRFNGQSVYEGESAYVSMYVQFLDNSYVTADFSGTIPAEFLTGYQIMEAEFAAFMQDIPVYVPKPLVVGNVNADVLAEMEAIVKAANFAAPDSLYISDIPLDEFFEMTVGLSTKEGITSGTELAPVMMPTPYSLVIVTVEDEAQIDAVRKDFEANIKWNKWVCVRADHAAIAQKGNMVLCLLGSGNLYTNTQSALTAEGWTAIHTLNATN